MFGSWALTFGRGRHRHVLHEQARRLGLGILDLPDLFCAAEPGTALLRSSSSVLIGQLFTRADVAVTASLPFAGDGPGRLKEELDGFWGNFALFSAGPGGSAAYRDPSGSVPVYRLGGREDALFVSDAGIARRLGQPARPRYDRTFVIHWLQFPFLRTRRSGLEGVVELLPGLAWTKSDSSPWTEKSWWRPADFLRRQDSIRNPRLAAERLRELACRTIPAQAGSARSLLQLSGGLDSSIIAACLASAGQNPSCVNFATCSADGDERRFARAVADRLGLALAEVAEGAPQCARPASAPGFRPPTNPLLAPVERAIAKMAEEVGASLLIDGGGGDNLFCSMTTASPVLDALRWAGLATARKAASDIALRAGCTFWDVLAAAGRRLVRQRGQWKEDRSFLARAVMLNGPELHPWLAGLRFAPPGKREHVEALVHIQHFLDRGDCGIQRLHPLTAQPLVELCLRIPSWLWVARGRDRAVARDAFSELVPRSVLERRTKGTLQGLFERSFAALRLQMLEILLSGELRRAGIIDAGAIETCLAGSAPVPDTVQMRISEVVALELWLQSLQPAEGDRSSIPS
jgi:asparagine synthase (glutamine-hydrolysing)